MIDISDPNFDEKEIFLKFVEKWTYSTEDWSYAWCYRFILYDFVAVELLGGTVFWSSISDKVNIVGNALLDSWQRHNWVKVDGDKIMLVSGHPKR